MDPSHHNCVLLWFHDAHWDLLGRISSTGAASAAGLPLLVQSRFRASELEHFLSSSSTVALSAIQRSVATAAVYRGPPRGGDSASRTVSLRDWSRTVPLRRTARQDMSLSESLLARIRLVHVSVPSSGGQAAATSAAPNPSFPAAAAAAASGRPPAVLDRNLRYVMCTHVTSTPWGLSHGG